MVKGLVEKMTPGMLWTIVIPVAVLIFSFSALTGMYSCVLWNARQVSSEIKVGNTSIAIEMSSMREELNSARVFNNNAIKLNQSLLASVEEFSDSSKQLNYRGKANNLTIINDKLKSQANTLNDQKIKLDAIDKELIEFEKKLRINSEKKVR